VQIRVESCAMKAADRAKRSRSCKRARMEKLGSWDGSQLRLKMQEAVVDTRPELAASRMLDQAVASDWPTGLLQSSRVRIAAPGAPFAFGCASPGRSRTRPALARYVVPLAKRTDVPSDVLKAMAPSATSFFFSGSRLAAEMDEEPSRYHGHLRVRCLRARPHDGWRTWRPALMKL